MKKVIFLSMLLLSIFTFSFGQTFPPAGTIDNSANINPQPLTNVAMTGNSLYITDASDFYYMNLSSPSTLNYICGLGFNHAYVGDFDNTGLFYYIDSYATYSNLFTIDLNNGTITNIAALHGADIAPFGAVVAMSYYNGVMYGIFSMSPYDVSASAVFSIDLSSGLCTRISTGTFPGFFVALAISPTGIFYGIDAEDGETGKFYHINPAIGTRTLISDTGLDTWTICGADFNDYTDKLYFTHPWEGIHEINTTTGALTQVSTINGYIGAVNSTGTPVPFNYFYILAAFVLIAGAIVTRKIFF